MYRYFQITGKDVWQPIKCGPNTEEEAKKLGATKLTMLSISDVINDETDFNKVAYKGPLYFDIDVKEDLDLAIKSTRKLVDKLLDLQVSPEVIRIYASGSKGMHVIVPAEVFSSGRQTKALPHIYAEMALRLDVIGMDYQVYSGGRGVCWRLSNIQRDDGYYRVPITHEELYALSAEDYKEIVKAPREIIYKEAAGHESAGLAVLFEQAKKAVKSKPKQVRIVSDEALAQFKEEPPHCITDLIDYKVKEDTKFNAVAMQLAIFVARSKATHGDAYASRVAKTSHSTQYNNEYKREAHVLSLTNYYTYKAGQKFSCAAMVSLLKSRPCEGCPQAGKFKDGEQLSQETEIIEKSDGYYSPGEHRDRPITNFVIDPIAVYMDISSSGLTDKRAGALVEYKQHGLVVGKSLFQETGWKTKAGFKEQILGIGDALSFTGDDNDVHRIMRMVYNSGKDIDKIVQTYTMGITFHKVGDRDIRVYVEPGYSVNQLGIVGTHNLEGNLMGAQKLVNVRPPKKGDMVLNNILEKMLKVNAPEVVAQILGWFSVCHLKTHYMYIYKEFPVLNLWGNAGAGKSRTADLFGWICGLDDKRTHTSVNLASITPWPIIEFCSTSTTVPRVLEEYNKSKLSVNMYKLAGEIIKCAWDGQNLPRGTLSGSKANGQGRTGASVVNIPITAPVLVISEQASDMPAHQHRMIQVLMNTNSRKGCEDSFISAYGDRERLKPLAKALTVSALNTDFSWVEEHMAQNAPSVPKGLEDRPKHSCKVILTGLDFLIETLQKLELPVAEKVKQMKAVMVDDLTRVADELIKTKKRTEVDSVMHDIAMMAGMTDGTVQTAGNWLIAGRHYVRKGNKLIIDAPIIHTLYKRYKVGLHETVVIDNTHQFLLLLAQESYYVDGNYPAPQIVKGRGMTLLDVEKLRDKGIIVDMFLES